MTLKLTVTRVFYWLMIHNFVLFVQIFAAGTITWQESLSDDSAQSCYYRRIETYMWCVSTFALCTKPFSGANIWGYLSRGLSTEYHIWYYTSKCSSCPVVFKSSFCHLGKPGITTVFKMASKTAATYRNDPWNNNASESNHMHKILFLNILIIVKMLIQYIYRYKYVIITI